MRQVIGFVACCLLASGAQAATIYQYAGNNFDTITDNDPPAGTYTTSMNVSGSFTVGAPLGMMGLADISASVLSWSFSDGRNTLTESNSTINLFDIAVGGSGQITAWTIDISEPLGSNVGDQRAIIVTNSSGDTGILSECTTQNNCGFNQAIDLAAIESQPGSWTVIPIPAAVWLFGSALGLLGWLKGRSGGIN